MSLDGVSVKVQRHAADEGFTVSLVRDGEAVVSMTPREGVRLAATLLLALTDDDELTVHIDDEPGVVG